VGLSAIAQYLHGSESLKGLFLQNNCFQGSVDVVSSFTSAVNSSQLKILVFSTHAFLSDSFISHFFPELDSRHLDELHLSMLGITSESLLHITSYLSSPRSRPLTTLKLNGNQLGCRSVQTIIRTVERHNFTLLRLEMYANGSSNRGTSSPSDDEPTWDSLQIQLDNILLRNRHLKDGTGRQALALLLCARSVLLRSPKNPTSTNACSEPVLSQSRSSHEDQCRQLDLPSHSPQETTFPFTSLPTELQLHVLSFIAPTLSAGQRLRVFRYCSNPSTLPLLLPRLGKMALTEDVLFRWNDRSAFVNPTDEARVTWLKAVGCNHYEED